MRVLYARHVEKLCTDEREMRRKRSDIAGKIKLRVNALHVAPTLANLPVQDPQGKWHPLTADRAGLWSGRLSRNHRIIIRPEGDGDAAEIVEVTVVEVGEDYH